MKLFSSLKNKISFLISGLILITGLAVVFLVFFLTSSFFIQEKKADFVATISEQVHESSRVFAEAQRTVQALSAHEMIVKYFSENIPAYQDAAVLNELNSMNIGLQYSAIYLLNLDGLALVSTDPRFVNQDYAFREYFQVAKAGKLGVMMAVGVTSNDPGYYFSAPVFNQDKQVIGIAVMKLDPKILKITLEQSVLSRSGKLMLVDKSGVILYSNTEGRLFKSLGALSAREMEVIITEQRFYNIEILPLQYELVQERLRKPVNSVESFEFYDSEDAENELIVIAPIENAPFFIVLEVDMDQVNMIAFQIAGLLGVFVLFLIIISVIASIFGVARLLKPLIYLKKNIEAIGRGETVSVNQIKTKDELQTIGESVVSASKLLQSSYKELEDRVAERTEALQASLKKVDVTKSAILNVLDDVNKERDRTKQLADDLVKFKQAVENASDHIVITDANGIILHANQAVEKITGFKIKDVLGKKAGSKELWGGYMDEEFYKKFWDTIKNKKKVFVGEITNKRKNGEKYQAEAAVSPILDDNGEVKFFLGIERDISERKDAEEQVRKVLNDLQEKSYVLAQEKSKDEALLAGIGDGIISTDQDGVVNIINRSAVDMLGYSEKDVMGKSFIDTVKIVDSKDNEISMTEHPLVLALSNVEKTTTPIGKTNYFKRHDGTKFAAGITASPFVLNGRIVGVILVFRDVSREKEVDMAKTEFVSLASHQLRTPLSTINWYAEMLLAGDAGKITGEQKEYVSEIYKGNQRMVELVNALLNVSRIELGTFSVEPEDTDLKELAESVFDELKPQLLTKKMKVTKKYDEKLKHLFVDKKLIRIVFQNLLTNALKYTPEKGKIDLNIQKRKSDILVSVTDTGAGIPKKDQQNIFQKLFRSDNVKALDTNGTGLGLYIVRSIVEQSAKGKIWFESEEGKGTTFYVSLPLTGMKAKEGTRALT